MNVITGLPRSGSTLLCNLLNQHPHIYASSTSILPSFAMGIIHTYSTSTEIKSDLIRDRDMAEKRIDRALTAFIDAYYSHIKDKEMIFDKSRGWLPIVPVLWKLYPHAKIVVIVRDPRGVLGSLEKQNAKNPTLDSNKERSITKRVEDFYGDEGMVGLPLRSIEDAIRRKLQVHYIKCEDFLDAPCETLNKLHRYLEIDNFEHNIDNVVNTATDVDALYLFKFPHEGSGKIIPCDRDEWKQFVPDEVSKVLLDKFSVFCRHFGYQ